MSRLILSPLSFQRKEKNSLFTSLTAFAFVREGKARKQVERRPGFLELLFYQSE